jgi:protoheme IX farnesyltransferase
MTTDETQTAHDASPITDHGSRITDYGSRITDYGSPNPQSPIPNPRSLFRRYFPLIKSLQTGLLLVTGLAGYMSGRCPVLTWATLLGLTASLFLAISGSTALNMVYDRDIDARMKRTCGRPLPTGQVTPAAALLLGLGFSAAGVGGAAAMDLRYGLVVFAGLFFDVVIYTVWLKRRTPYSIIFGGIAGGMPVLAGRTLAVGGLDAVGLLLALAVVLWIPTHIMTFSIRHEQDYRAAGIPTFPSAYGVATTRALIALSSVAAGVAMVAAALLLGMEWGYLRLLGVLSAGLLALAVGSVARPSDRAYFGVFKYASVYMLGSMALLTAAAL